ncbi:DUF3467 domain-containing protein [Candidatus Woesearchaeota archaeon]|nr:DUF3467 domain-containing protein [Candidatus Woesearchaeota archaeon]
MTEKTQINMHIVEGQPFFAHEATINFTPLQISLDFKCITPRSDPRNKTPSFQLIHNVVMMEPWQAKALIDVLKNVISNYESNFGKIKKSESLLKAERTQKKLAKKTENIIKQESIPPAYLG